METVFTPLQSAAQESDNQSKRPYEERLMCDMTSRTADPLCCRASEGLRSHPTFLFFLLSRLLPSFNLEKGDNDSFHGSYENDKRYMQTLYPRGYLGPLSSSSSTHQLENWNGSNYNWGWLVLWLVACWTEVSLGKRESLKLSQLIEEI